jgi:MoxR-like ATPase
MKPMKWIETHDGKFLAPLEGSHAMPPELLLARERVGLFQSPPEPSEPVEPAELMARAKRLIDEIASQLVAMQEEIELALVALLAGENLFFLSLPGAAKTTLSRMIAQGVEGRLFRINLNPDVSRNDLFGALDPAALREGRWARKLSGLATASVAIIDELFKASGSVMNMLLEAYEEHTLSEPDGTHRLPLLLGIAASNELVNATPQNAAWDRILLRKEVSYPSRPGDWEQLLHSDGGRRPIATRLDPQEIMLLQAYVEHRATALPEDVIGRMVRIRTRLGKDGIPISPRRFLGWARATTAFSMLKGEREVSSKSLLVGQHILWIGLEERDAVRNVVAQLSDPERQVLLAAAADVEEILSKAGGEENMQSLVSWQTKLKKHQQLLRSKVSDPDLGSERDALLQRIQEVQGVLVERGVAVMAVHTEAPR